ncbi:MAG: hypothetical protein ACI9OJ_002622 [Myxococcota bacterium]
MAAVSERLQRKPHTFLRGTAILSMLVLFESFAIPHLSGDMHLIAPWELLTDVGGLSFHAAVFFGVLLLGAALPMPYLARTIVMLGASSTLLVFAVMHMGILVDGFAFRGHPLLAAVFDGSPALLGMVTATLLFPAALNWRGRYTESFTSRIMVLVGILAVLAAYFLTGLFTGGSPPLLTLVSVLTHSGVLLADRISAALALFPIVLIVLSFLVFRRHPKTGGAGLWAWLFVTTLGAIPIVQAIMVSGFQQGQWKHVLAPLKGSLFLYAALLLLPVALGHFFGEVGWLMARRRATRDLQ